MRLPLRKRARAIFLVLTLSSTFLISSAPPASAWAYCSVGYVQPARFGNVMLGAVQVTCTENVQQIWLYGEMWRSYYGESRPTWGETACFDTSYCQLTLSATYTPGQWHTWGEGWYIDYADPNWIFIGSGYSTCANYYNW